MNYKIDTKENFDIITPQIAMLTSTLTDELSILINKSREHDKSVIIDFTQVNEIPEEFVDLLTQTHETMYLDNFSFVLCQVGGNLKQQLQEADLEDSLNIAPTLIEAIDIVSMEVLERELLGGE
jgi:anti-anti-sigma regulatory factor